MTPEKLPTRYSPALSGRCAIERGSSAELCEHLIELKKTRSWDGVAIEAGLVSGEAARGRVSRYERRKRRAALQQQHNAPRQEEAPTFVEVGANSAEAMSLSSQIRTLQQLLEVCEVDLEVWRVVRWEAKAWNVHAKKERTNLFYDEGVATGSTEKGGIEIAQLWSVWAKFARIERIAVFPTIQPIETKHEFKRPPSPTDKGMLLRGMILPDLHAWFSRDQASGVLTPWHDRRTMDLALQIAVAAEVDRIDLIGDLLDMTDWSLGFWTSPDMRNCLQPAIMEIHWWLSQLRQARPEAEINLYEGNHEARMNKAIAINLAAAYEIRAADEFDLPPAMSIPRLLALHQLGINWVGPYPDELTWLNEGLCLCHGDIARAAPGSTARAMAERYNAKVVFGHIHRREWVSVTKHLQDLFAYGFCPGCMCHLDGRVKGVRGRQNWQQGLAIVDYEVDGTRCTITPVEIESGEAIWNGRLFTARDTLPELEKAYPGWNWQ